MKIHHFFKSCQSELTDLRAKKHLLEVKIKSLEEVIEKIKPLVSNYGKVPRNIAALVRDAALSFNDPFNTSDVSARIALSRSVAVSATEVALALNNMKNRGFFEKVGTSSNSSGTRTLWMWTPKLKLEQAS